MEAILITTLAEWAKAGKPVEFGESLVLLLIAYFLLKREMDKKNEVLQKNLDSLKSEFIIHTQEMKQHIYGLTKSIDKTTGALVSLENNHAKKLDGLNERVTILERFKPPTTNN